MQKMTKLSFVLLAAVVVGPVWADVKLPQIFSDNMVLQRDAKVPIWGMAEPGAMRSRTQSKDS